jgi:hypothetical protein
VASNTLRERSRKLSTGQKYQLALDMLCGELTVSEVCCKHAVSASYAYRLRNRAHQILRAGISMPVKQFEELQRHLETLEQMVGDQAMSIRILKMKLGTRSSRGRT